MEPAPRGGISRSPCTVVLKVDGHVMSFGQNDGGQLGDGTTEARPDPIEVAVLGSDNAQVAAGGGNTYGHSVVLKVDGRVMSFGSNDRGQLGDGTTTDRNNPSQVTVLGIDNAQVVAGISYSLVLKVDGRVVGFGRNDKCSFSRPLARAR